MAILTSLTGLVIVILSLLEWRRTLAHIGQVLELADIAAGLARTRQTILFNDGAGLVGRKLRPRVDKLAVLVLQVGHMLLPIVIAFGLVKEIQQSGFIL